MLIYNVKTALTRFPRRGRVYKEMSLTADCGVIPR